MRIWRNVLLLIVLMHGSCAAATDEIDDFLKHFNAESLNGTWPTVQVPKGAPLSEVVTIFAATQKGTADAGQYEDCHVIAFKRLKHDPPELDGYTVVLVASSRGSRTILLMRPLHPGWWIRPYPLSTVP